MSMLLVTNVAIVAVMSSEMGNSSSLFTSGKCSTKDDNGSSHSG